MIDGDFPATEMIFITSALPHTAEIQSFSYIPAQVTAIQSLDEVELSQDEKILYLLDLDDTVFVHPFALGSREWRTNIKEQMLELLAEDPEIQQQLPSHRELRQIVQTLHDKISHSLALHAPVISVEPHTAQWIESLQQKGHLVQGLTARERNIWFYTAQEGVDIMTRNQLASIGIAFQNSEHSPAAIEPYAFGIHFSPLDDKGDYFEKILLPVLQSQGMPDKIIFIDDKLSHVESMAAALSRNGIAHHSYHYTAIDAKGAEYDPLIANIQLFHYWMFGKELILSDDEARALAKEHPDKEAASYLKPILIDTLKNG